MLRDVYNTLAFIPLICMLLFSTEWLAVYGRLGHMPVYSIDPDPSALHFGQNFEIIRYAVIPLITSLLIWPVLLILDVYLRRKNFTLSKIPTAAFFIGLSMLFAFHYTGFILWYLD